MEPQSFEQSSPDNTVLDQQQPPSGPQHSTPTHTPRSSTATNNFAPMDLLQSSVTPVITNSQPENFITTFPIPNPPQATAATSNTTAPKTLWMGDIDPYNDEEDIANIWKSMGKNVLVKLIKAKKGTPAAALNTNHAGYCFIEFETYEDAKMALSLNGSKIPNSNNNRLFRLNWASSATLSAPIPQSPEYSLFVGDLAPTTTEAHLLSLFQAHFKSVKTVRVMTDPTTGASRCFGFVRFSDEAERHEALIKMQGIWCAGRPLRVALATPRNANVSNVNAAAAAAAAAANFGIAPISQTGPPPLSSEMMMYSPYGMPYYGTTQFGIPVSAGGSGGNGNSNSPTQHTFSDPNNTTVFIGGLTNGVPESTLLQLFQPFGTIVHVKIPPGKGCGFVKFRNKEDAEAAISGMQGFVIGGSRVRLSWGRSQGGSSNNNDMSSSRFNGNLNPSSSGNNNLFYPSPQMIPMPTIPPTEMDPANFPPGTEFMQPGLPMQVPPPNNLFNTGGYYYDQGAFEEQNDSNETGI